MDVKELLLLKRTVEAICKCINLKYNLLANIKSEMWDDNARSLSLDKLEPQDIKQGQSITR